jgi:hypothetical protein
MYQLRLFTLQQKLIKTSLYLQTAFAAVAERASEHGKVSLLSREYVRS